MNEALHIWEHATPVTFFLTWIYFFIIVGIIGACNYGFKDGPDYLSEVEGKVLDTSDNLWKTPDQVKFDAEYNEAYYLNEVYSA